MQCHTLPFFDTMADVSAGYTAPDPCLYICCYHICSSEWLLFTSIPCISEIGNAYAVLSSPEKRKQYDLTGSEEPCSHPSNGRFNFHRGCEADITPEDLFNMFFGGAFPTGNYLMKQLTLIFCTSAPLFTFFHPTIQFSVFFLHPCPHKELLLEPMLLLYPV